VALPASDNFNRANANPAGGNWTTMPLAVAIQIISNQCAASGVGAAARWNADTFGNDQYSQF
jgi:hypothetical protein